MKQAPQIVVIGSINIDIIAHSDHLPRPGETVIASGTKISLGGKGANQASAAARLGKPVILSGKIGQDAFGEIATTQLGQFGVTMDHVAIQPETSTGIALIGIDRNGENAITVASGANSTVLPEDITTAAALLGPQDILLLQLELPLQTVKAACMAGRARGACIILDPAPAQSPEQVMPLMPMADFITPNETESAMLTGITPRNPEDADRVAMRLHEMGANGTIVKLGANGVFFSIRHNVNSRETGFVPPFAVSAIDSVAAGDCFNAGLACALLENMPIAQAVRFAAACGALATTRPGGAEAAPFRPEVEAMLQDQPQNSMSQQH